MATDLSGFSRGVAELGIIHFLQTIFESERILVPVVESHGGTLLKVEGDSFLAIFDSVRPALDAATAMQSAIRRYNEGKVAEEQLLLGVGLGFGRVLRVSPSEVYGNEMNSACILGETYAKGYDILVTQAVRDRAGEIRIRSVPARAARSASGVPGGGGAIGPMNPRTILVSHRSQRSYWSHWSHRPPASTHSRPLTHPAATR